MSTMTYLEARLEVAALTSIDLFIAEAEIQAGLVGQVIATYSGGRRWENRRERHAELLAAWVEMRGDLAGLVVAAEASA